jgi:thiol-disulfide isomerase/thioredoxin
VIVGGFAAAALLAAGLLVARNDPAGNVAPAVSAASPEAAPALAGTDPVTGQQLRLADFKGKPVVINIWASWCPGCIAEAADLARFARDHPEAQVLGIDFQDSVSGARAFYAEYGWRHPSIFDPDGDLVARLGLQGLPTTFFLDERHRIVTRIVGETDYAGFSAGLRQAKNA